MRPLVYRHDVLIEALRETFTPAWLGRQLLRPAGDRHVVAEWLAEYDALLVAPPATARPEPTGGFSVEASGALQCLLTLARDLDSVQRGGGLPKKLLGRLRARRTFQSARYELAVGHIFVDAGHTLEWIDKHTSRHVEFVAKDSRGRQIAVEAKARTRKGVLHAEEGASADTDRVGLWRLLTDALKQAPDDLPFVIFIDINLPLRRRDYVRHGMWQVELKRTVDRLRRGPATGVPDEFSLLCVTNLAWYYHVGAEALAASAPVFCWPFKCHNPLADDQAFAILGATNAYPWVDEKLGDAATPDTR
jgi:hypothetical protein